MGTQSAKINFIKKIRIKKNDIFTLIKNRKLMIDKILSYSSTLSEGIKKYNNANIKFIILITIGILLNNYMLISIPCCLLSIYFIVLMLKYIKYGSVIHIVKKLSKDLAFKGIYDKEKISFMLQEFKDRYGDENVEFRELVITINSYESFVMKLEYIIRGLEIESKRAYKEKELLKKYNIPSFSYIEKHSTYRKAEEENQKNSYEVKTVGDYYRDSEDSISMIYKDESGETKKVNRAIEFFEDENSEEYKNTLILKSNSKNNKNLTVYLYKKESNFQKNAL
ncbi:hypothetical protein [Clostridium neonatale]|uniref:hypothetical protein n=1 Tax=Clostridium neonatale TaxID=137838 RepID=UPI001D6D2C4A|nr:hypothetical protein [Clostridium neonatale]CAG9718533.1 Conserved hypothetical protein [Clostridium neonatale]